MIKLIATDIDGTLLNSERKITRRVHDTLQKAREKGVYVVLCTGRPLPGVKHLLEELDLITDKDFVITYNGALVQGTGDGKTYAHFPMNYQDFVMVSSLGDQEKVHYHAIDEKAIYVTTTDIGQYSFHESELTGMPIEHTTNEAIQKEAQFTKMMYIDTPELLNQLIANMPVEMKERYTFLRSEPYYLEVLNKQASKGKAVERLAQLLGIAQEEVMCLGDNENDLDMIEYAGVGVAMGNAVDSVKAVANYVTTTNNEDGVAVAVEKFVLE